ncbi:MAG: T9SS type A sorting domain-containing protein, partial [Alphaproteobacteria bacterium]|nr:T9SS type A sorting domain-containing protein [Alphaproteobacteria bacterium]
VNQDSTNQHNPNSPDSSVNQESTFFDSTPYYFNYNRQHQWIHINFDSLPNTGNYSLKRGRNIYFLNDTPFLIKNMNGWWFYQKFGNSLQSVFNIGNGRSTTGGVYSNGASGSKNRSLGTLATSGGIYNFGWVIKNNTEDTLNVMYLDFLTKQWRKGGSGNKNKWQFSYGVGYDSNPLTQSYLYQNQGNYNSLDTSLGASMLNGDSIVNQRHIIMNLKLKSWLPNQFLFLRWEDNDEVGSDDLMAIDAFRFKATYEYDSITDNQLVIIDSHGNSTIDSMFHQDTLSMINPIDTLNMNDSISLNNLPPLNNYLVNTAIYTMASPILRPKDSLIVVINFNNKLNITGQLDSLKLNIKIGTKTKSLRGFKIWDSLLYMMLLIDSADMDTNGLNLNESFILNGVEIKDSFLNTFKNKLLKIGTIPILIHPRTTFLKSMQFQESKTFYFGDTIKIFLNFSENVYWQNNNKPYLKILINNVSQKLEYLNGAGTKNLQFYYVIQANDYDTNGLEFQYVYYTNKSQLIDAWKRPIAINLVNEEAFPLFKINGILPSVESITIIDIGSLKALDTLKIKIKFSKFVSPVNNFSQIIIPIIASKTTLNFWGILNTTSDSVICYYIIPEKFTYKGIVKSDANMAIYFSKVVDQFGNPLSLKLPVTNFNIYIDGNSPKFVDSISRIEVCNNKKDVSLAEFLQLKGVEENEWLTIALENSSKIGFVYGWDTSVFTQNTKPDLSGFLWVNDNQNIGIDTLVFSITDNFYTSYKKVIIHSMPSFTDNFISTNIAQCVWDSNVINGTLIDTVNRPITYRWQTATENDSTSFYNISGQKYNYVLNALPNATKRWYRRVVSDGVCTHFSNKLSTVFYNQYLWIGVQDSNWHNPNNWCNKKTPPENAIVYLYNNSKFKPTITTSVKIKDLNILQNTQLTIYGRLELSGNLLAQTTTINSQNGIINFSGENKIEINGNWLVNNTIKSLVIKPRTQLAIKHKLIITNKLEMTHATMNTNDSLKVLYNTHFNINASVIVGKLEVLKPIPILLPNILSHPFINEINKDTNFNISYQLFQLPELSPANFFNNHFNSNLAMDSHFLKPEKVYFFDKPNLGHQRSNAFSHQLTGSLEFREKVYNIPSKDGKIFWIGNPFWNTINLGLLNFGSQLAPYYWVFERSWGKSGAFRCIPAGETYILKPLQSFSVYANQNYNNQLTIPLQAQIEQFSNYDNINYQKNFQGIGIQLSIAEKIFDEYYLFINSKSNKGFDLFDGQKILNKSINFYSKIDNGMQVQIEHQPHAKIKIPLYLESDTTKNFILNINQYNVPAGSRYFLIDNFTNQRVAIVSHQNINVKFEPNFSFNKPRFYLTNYLDTQNSMGDDEQYQFKIVPNVTTNNIRIYYNNLSDDYKHLEIYNSVGVLIYDELLGNANSGTKLIDISNFQAGNYLVVLKTKDKMISKKIIKL